MPCTNSEPCAIKGSFQYLKLLVHVHPQDTLCQKDGEMEDLRIEYKEKLKSLKRSLTQSEMTIAQLKEENKQLSVAVAKNIQGGRVSSSASYSLTFLKTNLEYSVQYTMKPLMHCIISIKLEYIISLMVQP